ncbi:myocardin-related transcription factor B isoform X2 [Protopterus annectens]|uniref:myocardin-related transcription factor B isoform X2 n=1 Tax=Protopterus annectens TaxID=7888 RepID=UPI001CF933D1|nr:myocardin-related transcription factor B isoform X2 [Protopterus annectens]
MALLEYCSPAATVTESRHSFKSGGVLVLQLRLQQRRTREQLAEQGIMPPLKSPAAFHGQIRSLERARTENFLKHKIRSRPERSELVRMHILEETLAEPSLQATQMKLKRARLADDLNEKIAQRPGPMELVEKNILPVDSSVKEAIIVGQVNYPKTLDAFSFDEDSSDALSPEQPASQDSQGSSASPGEPKMNESSSPVPNTTIQYHPVATPAPEFLKVSSALPSEPQTPYSSSSPTINSSTVSSVKPGPTLVKQSQPKTPNDRQRSKKSKDPKPRVRKLKYHQYIPPDQKEEKNEIPMDTNYARLLQQQQLFLQLQILSQRQHYNYQAILPAPLKPPNDTSSSGTTVMSTMSSSTPTSVSSGTGSSNKVTSNTPNRKPGPLPSNLDDMKVAELKIELKLRGLPVSGTKTDLIERLKHCQSCNNSGNGMNTVISVPVSSAAAVVNSSTGELTVAFPVTTLNTAVVTTGTNLATESPISTPTSNLVQMENINISSPPISPSPSENSVLSMDDTSMSDRFSVLVSPSQLLSSSPQRMNVNENSISTSPGSHQSGMFTAVEKDLKLQEKERQIEELKRKLEQEQKLVEELKQQLEVEKRSQQQHQALNSVSSGLDQKHFSLPVKDENSTSNCSCSRQPVTTASLNFGTAVVTSGISDSVVKNTVVKQEKLLGQVEPQNVVSKFYMSPQGQSQTTVITPSQAILTSPSGTPVLLPVSIQTHSGSSSVQVQPGNIKLQVFPSAATSNAIFPFQTQTTTMAQQLSNSSGSTVLQSTTSPAPSLPNGPSLPLKPSSPSQLQQQYSLPQPGYSSVPSKTKDPPRYEDAVKQSRSMQLSQQEETNIHSQQMDDLFDILIESGEISPLIKEETPPIAKMRPVTASITTMPVNTVVSRPPPQIRMAPPSVSQEPVTKLTITPENQLEAFLDGTLSAGNHVPQLSISQEETDSLCLIEDFQSDLLNPSSVLDPPHSPMDTSDLHFTADSCLTLDLHDTNLDSMEWLDISVPSSSTGFTLGSSTHNVFCSDFDPQDLQLQWD